MILRFERSDIKYYPSIKYQDLSMLKRRSTKQKISADYEEKNRIIENKLPKGNLFRTRSKRSMNNLPKSSMKNVP